ncbi:cytochrome P450 [Stipitochalara longipes BDJ]|nr:cytochrome P450 [Stipitochalara longipes BDJ]
MAVLNTESLLTTLGQVAIAVGIFLEIHSIVLDSSKVLVAVSSPFIHYLQKPRIWYFNITTILRDYRARKYYKPWKSSQKLFVIREKKQILEYCEAPELSQRAVYGDIFGFKHTLGGMDLEEQKVARTRLFGRVLRDGQKDFPILFHLLQERLEKHIRFKLGSEPNGWISIPLARSLRSIVTDLMGVVFFGENVSSDPKIKAALLQYPSDLVAVMGVLQIVPSFIAPIAHSLVTKGGKAMHTLLKQLASMLGTSREAWDETEENKKLTLIHKMAEFSDGSDYWTPESLSQAFLGIWFAAIHQPWMNLDFVLLELCSRPEYIELLREEIGDYAELDSALLEKLPLLDSFIKETVRSSPLDSMGVRRKALKPFTFLSTGLQVPTGSIVCVPAYAMMHDEISYPDPYTFDGSRFVSRTSDMRGTKYTDITEKFPVWGYGSLACPGRYHASLVMKLVIAYLISNFDMHLEDKTAPVRWSWETFTMPYERTRISLKKRVAQRKSLEECRTEK